MQHILKPIQVKNNSRKCPRLSVTLQLTSLTYQLWHYCQKHAIVKKFCRLDEKLINTSDFIFIVYL